jgi:hypothetical protein
MKSGEDALVLRDNDVCMWSRLTTALSVLLFLGDAYSDMGAGTCAGVAVPPESS